MTGKPFFRFDIETEIGYIFADEGDIRNTGFEGCCGASIISNFPILRESDLLRYIEGVYLYRVSRFIDNYNVTPKKEKFSELRPIWKKAIEDHILSELGSCLSPKVGHLYFVILNETQSWMGRILKKKDFRLVSGRTVNSNSQERLYVYLYDPVHPKGKSAKKRMFN